MDSTASPSSSEDRPRRPIPQWVNLPIRVLLTFALLFGATSAASRGIGYIYFLGGTPESLQKAAEWAPNNPEYYSARARRLQELSIDSSLAEIVALLEKAAALSPGNSDTWAELGGAYEWAGREDDAINAFARAVQLFPNSPKLNWKVGNFYIRSGRTEEALQALQRVVEGDPKLRPLTFDLAWRATPDPDMILSTLVPKNIDALFGYLEYLTHSRRFDEAGRVWKNILELGERFRARPALRYVNRLLRAGLTQQAVTAWDDLYFVHPLFAKRKSANELNLIENGDFEEPLFGYGFDWMFPRQSYAAVRVDRFIYFSGTRSLRIHFRGEENITFAHVMKFIPVKPDTDYIFSSYLKADDITTDRGPRLRLEDAADPSRLFLQTEELTGTRGWAPHTLSFRTGPETDLLRLRVVRNPSLRIDSNISGKLWLDRVTLREAR